MHKITGSLLLGFLFFLFSYNLKGQVAAYVFSQSNGTYQPVGPSGTPAAAFSTTWDDNSIVLPMPFNFTYNGVLYTTAGTIGIDTDTWLAFSTGTITMTGNLGGGSWISGSNTGMYLYGNANNNGFCGFNSDLNYQQFTPITVTRTNNSNILTGVSSYANIQIGTRIEGTGIPVGTVVQAFDANTITMSSTATSSGTSTVTPQSSIVTFIRGNAPNRQFVIQWTQAKRYSGSVADNFNLQMMINEGGGDPLYQTLQVIYGQSSTNATANIETQVGLRGNSSADFNARKSNNGWLNTIAATANTDSVRVNNLILPPSGLTFTWSPCNTASGNAGAITGSQTVCAGTSATYSLSAVNGATSYTWVYSGGGVTFTNSTLNPVNTFNFGPTATSGTITVTPSNACGSGVGSSLSINVITQPIISISYPSSTYCEGAATLSVNQTGTSGGTYTISPTGTGVSINSVSGQVTIPNGITGNYTVTYSITSGACTNSTTTTISIVPKPTITATASPSFICVGGAAQLNASISSGYLLSSVPFNSLAPTSATTTLWNTYTDEAVSAAIPLPFTFTYYGQSVNQLFVYSNGYITLQSSFTNSLTPQTLPSAVTPNNVIALAWDDLVIDPSVNPTSSVSYFVNGTAPNRIFVIQFNKLTFYAFNNAGDVTGQIRLYEADNHIEIAAENVNDVTGTFTKTMGIEDASGSNGISPTGRNNTIWNTANEGWAFYLRSAASYAWSPNALLNNPLIANPVASNIVGSITFTATITDNIGCTGSGTVTVTPSGSMSGTYTVGSGGNYPTLTAAVNAYNTSCIAGPIIFQLIDATYSTSETFPIIIQSNSFASAINTLTIKPAPGVNATITGSSTIALIKLNGADYVIIDGSNAVAGTTQNLTLVNTSSNSSSSTMVWLCSTASGNGATNNVLKNCKINGNASTSIFSAVLSSGSVAGTVAEAPNNNNVFTNNQISKCVTALALVGPAGNEGNNVISNNTFGSSITANRLSASAIELYQQKNTSVLNNTISGITSNSSTEAVGIGVYGTDSSVLIANNRIFDIKNTSTGNWSAMGIYLSTNSTNSGVKVYNNMISDVAAYGYGTQLSAIYNGHGIAVDNGGGYGIYFNSVLLNTNQTISSFPAALFVDAGLSAGAIDLRNNLLINRQSQAGQHYAIECLSAANVFSAIDFNDYFVSSGNLGYIGSNRNNLAAIITGFGQNSNSVSVNPVFIAAPDLHIDVTANASLSNLGIPLAGITDDVDGYTRNGTNPDLGADEWLKPNTGSWVGKYSIEWTLPGNWEDNFVPDATTDISVTGGYTFLPTLITTQAVRNINMTSPAIITILNGNLQLFGNITSTGGLINALKGTFEVKRNSPAQTLSGSWFTNRSISTLINSNAAGLTLNGTVGDTLKVLSALLFGNVSSSILTTNNNLTIASSDTATARVGIINNGNSISGNATVERYIPLHSKAWQFLSVPTTGQTIKAAWQEGATIPNGNPVPGYGTQIVGNVAGAITQPSPGFDVQGNTAGVKTWNRITGNWDGINSTTTPIANSKGYMLFVRGDRSVTTFNAPPTATCLRTTGTLYSPANPPVTVNALAGYFESIGNPYASAISFDSVGISGGVQRNFYVWDPKLTNTPYSVYGFGAFQAVASNFPAPGYTVVPGQGSYTSDTVNIQSGQAFFVYAPFSNGTVTFTENAKTKGSSLVTRQTQSLQQIRNNLYVNINGERVLLDGTVVQFNDYYLNEPDIYDAYKPANFGENLGIIRSNKMMAIERRKPVVNTDTIFYNLSLLRQQQYFFEFLPENWQQPGVEAFLEDTYLNTRLPLSLTQSTWVPFSINTTAGSSIPQRFRIVFKPAATVPVKFISISAQRKSNLTVDVNWKVAEQNEVLRYEIEHSIDGFHFNKLTDHAVLSSVEYWYNDLQASSNINYYRIKAVEFAHTYYSETVVVQPVKKASSIVLLQNPIVGNSVQLKFLNAAGMYDVQLINPAGQICAKDRWIVSAGAEVKSLSNVPLSKGIYILKLVAQANEMQFKVIIQ